MLCGGRGLFGPTCRLILDAPRERPCGRLGHMLSLLERDPGFRSDHCPAWVQADGQPRKSGSGWIVDNELEAKIVRIVRHACAPALYPSRHGLVPARRTCRGLIQIAAFLTDPRSRVGVSFV